jgi:hypothetical protein
MNHGVSRTRSEEEVSQSIFCKSRQAFGNNEHSAGIFARNERVKGVREMIPGGENTARPTSLTREFVHSKRVPGCRRFAQYS